MLPTSHFEREDLPLEKKRLLEIIPIRRFRFLDNGQRFALVSDQRRGQAEEEDEEDEEDEEGEARKFTAHRLSIESNR